MSPSNGSGAISTLRQQLERIGNITPGPGNYNHKTSFEAALKKGAPIGPHGEIVRHKANAFPGPGAHEHKAATAFLAATKKGAPIGPHGEIVRFKANTNPGPGAHEVIEKADHIGKARPKFTHGVPRFDRAYYYPH